ncbi:IS4 family transposase [Streptomyces sp. So13.3]|uniref:IS4 family transposase n=1 Tax=unclassified Streptomyces TaxID=2593676 RepID=UPI001106E72A|nr:MULTISPECIES: IS4 family transposase [unclassified Streptomyces]MCZ4103324.1 IS4 family transposase [Streptomyces sp. H39-C1]QNA71809.1 IS4 family transposase [Streptomyces sp. So13.3]
MDQGAVEAGRPVARPDQVSLGVLVAAVPRFKVDEAAAVCGVAEQRRGGKLPPHVTAYLTMALCLFADDGAEEVAQKVTGSLSEFGVWDAAWEPPTSSGITQARKRLGRDVLRETFYRVAEPVAAGESRGAWLRQWRLMAIDGFDLDLPDTAENAAEFGYAGNDQSRSAFPKARVVAVVECGSHAFMDAEVGPWNRSEKAMAASLLISISSDWLLLADRGFYSFAAFSAATQTGAALCWRAPTQLRLPVLEVLSDGSYLSALVDPAIRGREREELLDEARSGAKPDPAAAHVVRVVEYDVPDRDGQELICLITNITDHDALTAGELAGAYQQRWEEETANGQLKSILRGPGKVLRSKSPDLVHQEIWAYLLVHYAINSLICQAATGADIDPDRISFLRTVNIVRRTATGTAAFPP